MTVNQSTVKSDMATVDYGSFQPAKPYCLLSNCLSYQMKMKGRKRLRGKDFHQLLQRSYALGSNAHKALMSTLWSASGSHHYENSALF